MSRVSELTDEVAALGSQMFKVRFPFVQELRHYSWEKARADLLAGATLTLVSIPQAIGFSLILNLPPQPVIAAVIIGGLVGALFFSSHHHVFGPTSSISLIVAATIAANSGLTTLEPLQLAIYLAFLIGVIQFLAGLLNFGEITKFISRSVVVGYSTGIGVLLIGSQLHNFLGYDVGPAQSFLVNVIQAGRNLATLVLSPAHLAFSPWAVGVGVLTLLVFMAVRRFRPSWPEALIGLALLGLLARLLTVWDPLPPFRMVRDEGALHAVFPAFAGFHFGARKLELLPELAGTAIAISILGMLEAASITKSLAGKSGQKIEPNQELMGMGAANIACALFGCVPGSSSFARSAVNFQSGARTQMSSILSSFVVLLVLLFVTPVFNFIPVAALAAHLIRVGLKMINLHQIRIACPPRAPTRSCSSSPSPPASCSSSTPPSTSASASRSRSSSRKRAPPPSPNTPSTPKACSPSCAIRRNGRTLRSRSSTSRATSTSARPISSRSRSAGSPRTRTSASSSCG
jgi:SulP family sulfate permease